MALGIRPSSPVPGAPTRRSTAARCRAASFRSMRPGRAKSQSKALGSSFTSASATPNVAAKVESCQGRVQAHLLYLHGNTTNP